MWSDFGELLINIREINLYNHIHGVFFWIRALVFFLKPTVCNLFYFIFHKLQKNGSHQQFILEKKKQKLYNLMIIDFLFSVSFSYDLPVFVSTSNIRGNCKIFRFQGK